MRLVAFLNIVASFLTCIEGFSQGITYKAEEFSHPEIKWRPVPLWFWNNTEIDSVEMASQLENMLKVDGYGGCAILPFGQSFYPTYLSEDYFSLYQKAIEIVKQHGAVMSVYDEYGFPSGSMGQSMVQALLLSKIITLSIV